MAAKLLAHRRASADAGTLQRIICSRRLIKRGDQPIEEVRRHGRDHVVITQNLLGAPLGCRTYEITRGFMNQARSVLDLLLGLRTHAELESG